MCCPSTRATPLTAHGMRCGVRLANHPALRRQTHTAQNTHIIPETPSKAKEFSVFEGILRKGRGMKKDLLRTSASRGRPTSNASREAGGQGDAKRKENLPSSCCCLCGHRLIAPDHQQYPHLRLNQFLQGFMRVFTVPSPGCRDGFGISPKSVDTIVTWPYHAQLTARDNQWWSWKIGRTKVTDR